MLYSMIAHTTSFNTKGLKGRDSALGIGRKLSNISPGATSEQLGLEQVPSPGASNISPGSKFRVFNF